MRHLITILSLLTVLACSCRTGGSPKGVSLARYPVPEIRDRDLLDHSVTLVRKEGEATVALDSQQVSVGSADLQVWFQSLVARGEQFRGSSESDVPVWVDADVPWSDVVAFVEAGRAQGLWRFKVLVSPSDGRTGILAMYASIGGKEGDTSDMDSIHVGIHEGSPRYRSGGPNGEVMSVDSLNAIPASAPILLTPSTEVSWQDVASALEQLGAPESVLWSKTGLVLEAGR